MALSNLSAQAPSQHLTNSQVDQYHEHGYVKNLPVFDASEISTLQATFEELAARLPDGTDINQVTMWHKCSRTFYDLSRHPAILDYVEDLIGPDFFQWAGQFFVKYPGDGSEVPWHQDAQYWPLSPQQTVSVWLAVYDTDTNNAAMQVVSGSHRRGPFLPTTQTIPPILCWIRKPISQIANPKTLLLSISKPGKFRPMILAFCMVQIQTSRSVCAVV